MCRANTGLTTGPFSPMHTCLFCPPSPRQVQYHRHPLETPRGVQERHDITTPANTLSPSSLLARRLFLGKTLKLPPNTLNINQSPQQTPPLTIFIRPSSSISTKINQDHFYLARLRKQFVELQPDQALFGQDETMAPPTPESPGNISSPKETSPLPPTSSNGNMAMAPHPVPTLDTPLYHTGTSANSHLGNPSPPAEPGDPMSINAQDSYFQLHSSSPEPNVTDLYGHGFVITDATTDTLIEDAKEPDDADMPDLVPDPDPISIDTPESSWSHILTSTDSHATPSRTQEHEHTPNGDSLVTSSPESQSTKRSLDDTLHDDEQAPPSPCHAPVTGSHSIPSAEPPAQASSPRDARVGGNGAPGDSAESPKRIRLNSWTSDGQASQPPCPTPVATACHVEHVEHALEEEAPIADNTDDANCANDAHYANDANDAINAINANNAIDTNGADDENDASDAVSKASSSSWGSTAEPWEEAFESVLVLRGMKEKVARVSQATNRRRSDGVGDVPPCYKEPPVMKPSDEMALDSSRKWVVGNLVHWAGLRHNCGWTQLLMIRLMGHIKNLQPDFVSILGSRDGASTKAILKFFKPDCAIYGWEYSRQLYEASLAVADRIMSMGYPGELKFQMKCISEWEPDNEELVVCMDTLQGFSRAARLYHMARILDGMLEDGVLAVQVPLPDSLPYALFREAVEEEGPWNDWLGSRKIQEVLGAEAFMPMEPVEAWEAAVAPYARAFLVKETVDELALPRGVQSVINWMMLEMAPVLSKPGDGREGEKRSALVARYREKLESALPWRFASRRSVGVGFRCLFAVRSQMGDQRFFQGCRRSPSPETGLGNGGDMSGEKRPDGRSEKSIAWEKRRKVLEKRHRSAKVSREKTLGGDKKDVTTKKRVKFMESVKLDGYMTEVMESLLEEAKLKEMALTLKKDVDKMREADTEKASLITDELKESIEAAGCSGVATRDLALEPLQRLPGFTAGDVFIGTEEELEALIAEMGSN
ncbi:hypothetical protein QBC39DRAFT_175291 [Podospora conica]|nr:hypothetical protein QBC39DRAFT_175291 [Schizothecium conicum]